MTTATSMPRFGTAIAVGDLPRRAFVATVMGLPVSVLVRGPRARDAAVAARVERALDALRADDALFSTWRRDSEVSRIRRGELRVKDAAPRLRLVARLCEEAEERTGGSFSAWLPGPGGTPAFDPSGLVKGWAVEQAFVRLRRDLASLGRHDVLINAGGDVVLGCSRLDTPDWQVGVEDPRDRTRLLFSVPLRSGAVATSGTAARGAHIVDPATGRAAGGDLLSSTVVGPELTWADVYATAAFVRGLEGAAWIAARPRHTGAVVTADGSLVVGGGPGQPVPTPSRPGPNDPQSSPSGEATTTV